MSDLHAPRAVPYLPPRPKSYHPCIGLIGAGGISEFHLRNYQEMGLRVTAIADRDRERAEQRKAVFFPDAGVFSDYRDLLACDEIEVVDITPHPQDRLPIIEAALHAGKHVLSQKPFTLDLTEARRLADLADCLGLKLAINQNGRWAPHFSYIQPAIATGVIGEVVSMDFTVCWDHTWTRNVPAFGRIRHLVLYDFVIHWFDIVHCFMSGQPAESVHASTRGFPSQLYAAPSLAAVVIDYPTAQARMGFNAHALWGQEDVTTVVGTRGTMRSRGPGLNNQPEISLFLEDGSHTVPLKGAWLSNGFQGTMGELLCSIEENRNPSNNARHNIGSLELCFAAMASADSGRPVVPGSVTTVGRLEP